jgi:hypothetical protein
MQRLAPQLHDVVTSATSASTLTGLDATAMLWLRTRFGFLRKASLVTLASLALSGSFRFQLAAVLASSWHAPSVDFHLAGRHVQQMGLIKLHEPHFLCAPSS